MEGEAFVLERGGCDAGGLGSARLLGEAVMDEDVGARTAVDAVHVWWRCILAIVE